MCIQVRSLALERLSEMKLPWLERINIARQFKVVEWLVDDYAALIHSWGTIQLEKLAETFGWEMTARLSDLAAKAQIPISLLASDAPRECGGNWQTSCTWVPKTVKRSEHIRFVCSCCNREYSSRVGLKKGVRLPLHGQSLAEAIKAAFPGDFN